MSKIYSEISVANDYEKLKKQPSKRKKQFCHVCDSLVSIFVVAPLVVGAWRGTWNLINYYGEYFPLWSSLIASFSCILLLNYFRRDIHYEVIDKSKNTKSFCKTVKRFLITRIYHYFFQFCSIMSWRCLWEVVPQYWGEKLLMTLNILNKTVLSNY